MNKPTEIAKSGWGEGVDYTKSKFKMNTMFDIRIAERIPAKKTKESIVTHLNKSINGSNKEDTIEFLKKELIESRLENEDLRYSLNGTDIKNKTVNCGIEENDVKDFFSYGEVDQKLMAHLFWEHLTEDMKNSFMDKHFMNDIKHIEKNIQERMDDPNKMRQHFLKGAAPIMNDMISMAKGTSNSKADAYAFKEVWEVLRGIIETANAKAPILDLRGKDVSTQIDEVLSHVTAGKITFDQAKEYMSLISSGFNLQELPKLLAKLDQLES